MAVSGRAAELVHRPKPLGAPAVGGCARPPKRGEKLPSARAGAAPELRSDARDDLFYWLCPIVHLAHYRPEISPGRLKQIGRASCRERGKNWQGAEEGTSRT